MNKVEYINPNSVQLSDKEYESFLLWLRDMHKKEAALRLDVTRSTLDRVLATRSGKKETIDKILNII